MSDLAAMARDLRPFMPDGHIYHVSSGLLTVSANGNQIWAPMRTDYNIEVARISVALNPAATNNGSNYWTWTIRGVSSASYATATNIHSDNTSATTAGAWALGNAVPGVTTTPGTAYALDLQYAKTGTPGNLTIIVAVYYRLIST